jgi:N-acetylglucosamine-6-phosphate deacetylase
MSVTSQSQNNLTLINVHLPNYDGLQRIQINSSAIITSIMPMDARQKIEQECVLLDLNGDWLSLGGIDLQINGGLGLSFTDLDSESLPLLEEICDFLWQQGIDGFLPTIVTTSLEKIQKSLAAIAEFINIESNKILPRAKILGVHLEGPFLNYEKRGAHLPEYLLPLTLDNIKKVIGNYASVVKVITLAPELDITAKVIPYLKESGIIISLGHSSATAQEAKNAFDQGASMVTHAFNAMPGLHHREPGLLGEAIINPNVYCGLIADGQHVCQTMIKLLLKASNYEQGIFLVSDALAPIGLPDGIYPWDNREIEVKDGTARLFNGTLSGTTLPLLVGVKNLVNWEVCEIGKAIAMATQSPRKAIGLTGISVGKVANFLRWHWRKETATLTWQRWNSFQEKR